ncbi:Hsp33 family molecular chaperone HslO [Gammaproteobacteria bacterium]|nr:Hsp33 family molecular chaperone HslO [Gammaproteobacteria bacterium]
MNSKDQLFRFIFENLDIRGELIYLESSWQAMLERHVYPEHIQQQLGQATIAAALLSATIKFDGSLILQIQGDGPLYTLVTQASSDGSLRGLAKWTHEVPNGLLEEIYGKGRMVITIRPAQGEPYQSIVPLVGNSLGAALESYFIHSEQLKSRFWFFVDKQASSVDNPRIAGLFLQELPSRNADDDTDWERLSTLAQTTTAEEIFSLAPEQLLNRLFHEEQVRLYEPKPFRFKCGCSRKKIESSLIAMGQDSLLEILQEEHEIKADCEFCYQHYSFSAADVDKLFPATNDPDKVLH